MLIGAGKKHYGVCAIYHTFDPDTAKAHNKDFNQLLRNTCKHLRPIEQRKLFVLLSTYDDFSNGTMGGGGGKTKLVSLDPKEGATPHHGIPFPASHIHVDPLKRGIEQL